MIRVRVMLLITSRKKQQLLVDSRREQPFPLRKAVGNFKRFKLGAAAKPQRWGVPMGSLHLHRPL